METRPNRATRLTRPMYSDSLLISFCNQGSSPDRSLLMIAPGKKRAGWVEFTHVEPTAEHGLGGVCGLCQNEEHVFFVTQGNSLLAAVSRQNGRLVAHIFLELGKDCHSMVYLDSRLYIVSTGTNQILSIPWLGNSFGQEEVYWTHPQSIRDRDSVHLNGLTLDGGRLIASCFGPRETSGSWEANGSVFYVDTGETVAGDLLHPHSPVVLGDRLAFAESGTGRIHLYRRGLNGWRQEHVHQLDGYTRGIAFTGHHLLVATSRHREMSRSTGRPVAADQAGRSALYRLDLESRTVEPLEDMRPFGREIYDVLATPPFGEMGEYEVAERDRILHMESWHTRYMKDLHARAMDLYTTSRDQELVSVIIPTYNRARFIGECLTSVLDQTYENLEIIIVDDGSTDGTRKVVESFSDPRILYVHQENRGRSAARNRALSLARGKYITFLDSDDLYVPEKVALQVEYLRTHPGTAMVYTSARCIDGTGAPLEYQYLAMDSGFLYRKIAFFRPVTITLPTVMTYRRVLEEVGPFDENMHRFEDTDMWRRISKGYRIDAMGVFTCFLRTHDDNALTAQDARQIEEALRYYAEKILREDGEMGKAVLSDGIADLYHYYADAMLATSGFEKTGARLRRIARSHESVAHRITRNRERLERALKAMARRLIGFFRS